MAEKFDWNAVAEAKRLVARAEAQGDILRDQFEQRPEEDRDPTWTIATKSSNPSRPRTTSASYWRNQGVVQITFRNGDVYGYGGMSVQEAAAIKRSQSVGKLINRKLDAHPYWPAS